MQLNAWDINEYLAMTRKFPMLEPEEEYQLAKRYQKNEDPAAADRLISSHLRLVAKAAGGFRGYDLPLNELIAEGNVGLMQALKRFEPDRGFKFATYAMWWIRAAIQEHILHNWSMVKLGTTAAQKKLFFNLRKIKSQINAMESGDMSPENVSLIAAKLDVTAHDVVNMNRRLSGSDYSLNVPLKVGDPDSRERQDFLVDDSPSQETILAEQDETNKRRKLAEKAMAVLTERERVIFMERRLKEPQAKLEDLAAIYKVSRERIRQIEVRAFEKFQDTIREQARQTGMELTLPVTKITNLDKIDTTCSKFQAALKKLPRAQRRVLEALHLQKPPVPMEKLRNEFGGFATQRIRYMEQQALNKISRAMYASENRGLEPVKAKRISKSSKLGAVALKPAANSASAAPSP